VNWLFWGVGFSRGHQIGIGQLEVIAERWNIEVFFFFLLSRWNLINILGKTLNDCIDQNNMD